MKCSLLSLDNEYGSQYEAVLYIDCLMLNRTIAFIKVLIFDS